LKRIIDIIKNPAEAIKSAKKEGDLMKTSIIMIEGLLFAVVAMIIMMARFGFDVGSVLSLVATVFVGGSVAMIVLGYLLKITMNILGGHGSFYEGLTAVTYSVIPLSVGLLIVAVLSYIPILGIFISFLIMSVLGVMGAALFYRATKEMFATDMITTMVGISVLILGLFIAFYISAITGVLGMSSMLGEIPVEALTNLTSLV